MHDHTVTGRAACPAWCTSTRPGEHDIHLGAVAVSGPVQVQAVMAADCQGVPWDQPRLLVTHAGEGGQEMATVMLPGTEALVLAVIVGRLGHQDLACLIGLAARQAAPPQPGGRAVVGARGGPAAGEHRVAVLSAAVLRAARTEHGESRAGLAARAGLARRVVDGAEDGTRPAWALPYEQFTALAGALTTLDPRLHAMFETAAACDLLLTNVLAGDQVMATDVLTDPGTRDLAAGLLGWAVTGAPGCGHAGQRLSRAPLALLRDRAAALAASGSADAWVGGQILAVIGAVQS
jgi:hypothetical protein